MDRRKLIQYLLLNIFVSASVTGTILFWWLALAVGVDVWLLVTCRRRLHERFRDLAVGHYGPLRPEATAAPAPVPALASAPAVGSVSGKPS